MCTVYIHTRKTVKKRRGNDIRKRVAEMCIISTTRFCVLWTIRNTQTKNDDFKGIKSFYIIMIILKSCTMSALKI